MGKSKPEDIVAPFPETLVEIKEAGGETYRFCYQCGKCDVVCPWNRVREFSIRKIIREAAFGLTQIEDDDVWRCTTCGTCPQQCPRGVKQIELSVSLRRIASNYDVFPASARAARSVRGSLRSDGNPLNEDRKRRADWAKDLAVRPFAEGMELLYFVGCYYCYDPRLKKVAAATARILQRAGVDFGILGEEESCCGESIRKTGGEEVFRALARQNIKTFIDRGVKKILVSSPHCYHTLKNEYPDFMVRFEVVHLSQLLVELIRQGRLSFSREFPRTVTYHDPCYLGRHNGLYEEPREILRAIPGLHLVEMANARQDSLCCGGGGGRIWMDTPKNERFSELRLEQADAVEAEVLATCCPYCITMFEDSRLGRPEGDPLRVMDLTEIVVEAL
ncbi:MAG: (Fe-S)-binding protein [Polyangia bacterium]|jgi:Fe-S oxidoreductase|nr:(Fe-S)-binding protein [Polyangia bacterium]